MKPYLFSSGAAYDSIDPNANRYAAGEYCLAPSDDDEDEATVLACEPCTSEVINMVIDKNF